jgi:hypothetical protein
MDSSNTRYIQAVLMLIMVALLRWVQRRFNLSPLMPWLHILEIIVLAGLAAYLFVCAVIGVRTIVRRGGWLSRRNDAQPRVKGLGYVFRSLSWATVMVAAAYVVHPRLSNHIQYRLGLGMPWLPDVCWIALPFGVAMTYLTSGLGIVRREQYDHEQKRQG